MEREHQDRILDQFSRQAEPLGGPPQIRDEVALNRIVDTAIPSVPIVSREEGTLVIPGHGHVCDQLDVVEYRDMVSIVRDRIRDLIKTGMTLDQIKAAAPTRGYTRRYGAETNFVEAVYRSLGGK